MADVIQQLKSVSVTVNGEILLGVVDKVDIPEMELETEEVRLGGMDTYLKVETGQSAMECTVTLKGIHSVLATAWGTGVPDTRIEVRGAREDYNGNVTQVKYIMVGLATAYRHADALEGRGELPTTELVINPNYYEHSIDGQVEQKIDVLNMIREVAGNDRLERIREVIGA